MPVLLRVVSFCCLLSIAAPLYGQAAPAEAPQPIVVLDLPGSGTDPAKIDYASLPKIKVEHAVLSPEDEELRFQLHSYLIHHGGKFWSMWSQGPPVEDEPTQHIRYATSEDGIAWSDSKVLAAPDDEEHGCIARGLWLYDGELLALVAHFRGKGAFGVNKELQLRAYRWDEASSSWKLKGLAYDNAINNFPPQKLSTGDWIMTRRDPRFNVSVLIGGRKGFDAWESFPVVERRAVPGFSPDEPILWEQPDGKLVALYRDNGGSQRLFRSFSEDHGRTWTLPQLTNFPNSTSKLFSLRTSTGMRVMFSNANPSLGRRELHLSLTPDGLTFTRLGLLDIPSARPSTLQYPHAIEHDGYLYVAFSRNKRMIEVARIPLAEVARLQESAK